MQSAQSPIGLLVSRAFLDAHEERLGLTARQTGLAIEPIALPEDPDGRVPAEACARIELAFFSRDVLPRHGRAFFAAALAAEKLRWLHVFHAGVDHPIYPRLLERGVLLTNSPGTSAQPIAQTAIAGLLMLARGFPHWLAAQRRRAWEPIHDDAAPRDLAGQTLVVVGLGGIGCEIARLAQALGLHVIGVRRSPRRPTDSADELHPPDALPALLPRADWLALACPLTDETRRMIDARALAALPPGARLINVARGELVDEAALARALQSGALAGAYLDVFETEPLPPGSPLWELPNAIITPHNSAASRGNEARQLERFFENLARFGRGEPLAGS
jgi:phosphoglycerate dehydrogenase-like enzyme